MKELNAFEVLRLYGKRQGADLLLVEQVFGAFEEIQAVGDNGATEIESRSSVTHALEMPAANEKVGKRVIQAVAPLLASATRIGRHDTRGEATILCEVRHLRDFDGLHTVDGDAQSKAPGSGIGHVDRIDQQRAMVFAEARDADGASGPRTIPGISGPDGSVRIAGFGEDHSALLVNSVDVTDPATGAFGLSVPIDSVQTMGVLGDAIPRRVWSLHRGGSGGGDATWRREVGLQPE